MKLTVYGTGCAKCNKLAEVTERVAKAQGLDFTLEKVTDITKIMEAGVMMTPALMVNGKVKVSGRVPTDPELVTFLMTEAGDEK